MSERYERIADLMRLVVHLQASAVGLTIDRIAELFHVSRRTAERMLGAVRRAFPDMESRDDEDGRRHWRLARGSRARGLVRVEATELAALETAIELVARDGRTDQATSLRELAAKVRALSPGDSAPRIETDTEALLAAEGVAMRPGPRPRIDAAIVDTLRLGILACRELLLHYRSRGSGRESRRTVRPYGFVLGGRHYLVAYDLDTESVRMFSLSDVLGAEFGPADFEHPDDFDLAAYAARSFGVFQEKPHDVVLRFKPEVAHLAREYQLHPSQVTEEQDDGALVVRFQAGGLWEMAFHLFQWRDGVQVIEPEALRLELVSMLEAALAVHRQS